MKYKVWFHGFAYVEADSEDEAQENYLCGDTAYEEVEVESVTEVDEFAVRM